MHVPDYILRGIVVLMSCFCDALLQTCSLLAFVLDQLLPQCQNAGDKDCPALARVFLASIASCTHCPEAQTTLVSEVKAALQRALALPESAEKHSRVQAMMAIISTIIEACPNPPGSVPNSVSGGGNFPEIKQIFFFFYTKLFYFLKLTTQNNAFQWSFFVIDGKKQVKLGDDIASSKRNTSQNVCVVGWGGGGVVDDDDGINE